MPTHRKGGTGGNVQDVRQPWAARMSEPLLGEQTAWAGADEEGNSSRWLGLAGLVSNLRGGLCWLCSLLSSALNMSVRLDTKSPERYQELLDQYDTWMFDCDGVLWRGDRLIDGAAEVLHILRSQST
jgi:hypothetical protein